MKKVLPLFTITLFFFLSTHTSEESPYTVTFADDTTHQYPAELVKQFVMIKEGLELFPNDNDTSNNRTLDLSRSRITKTGLDTLTEHMRTSSTSPVDLSGAPVQAVLDAITAADYLLESTHPALTHFLDFLVAKSRTKEREDRRDFYTQFTNKQAQLFIKHIKQQAPITSIHRQLITQILFYVHNTCGYSQNEFPVPSPATGQPVLGPIPLSVQDLIDAGRMPAVHTDLAGEKSLNFSDEKLTSLEGLETLPFPAVHYLHLYSNNLTHIAPNTLESFTDLIKLGLSGNQIPYSSLKNVLLSIPTLRTCFYFGSPLTEKEQQMLETSFPNICFTFHESGHTQLASDDELFDC